MPDVSGFQAFLGQFIRYQYLERHFSRSFSGKFRILLSERGGGKRNEADMDN